MTQEEFDTKKAQVVKFLSEGKLTPQEAVDLTVNICCGYLGSVLTPMMRKVNVQNNRNANGGRR